jgi:hypothetical protein
MNPQSLSVFVEGTDNFSVDSSKSSKVLDKTNDFISIFVNFLTHAEYLCWMDIVSFWLANGKLSCARFWRQLK